MDDKLLPVVPACRRLVYIEFAIAAVLGLLAAVFAKASHAGLLSDKFLGATLLLVLLMIVHVFAKTVLKGLRSGQWLTGIFLGVGYSFTLAIIFIVNWVIVGWSIVPDPAPVYFYFRKSHIESHWRTDPVTDLSYFPLDYWRVDTGASAGRYAPVNFYVLDKKGSFIVGPDGELYSPACPGSKYRARKIDDRVYYVRNYIDDVDETSDPCLITPTLKPG